MGIKSGTSSNTNNSPQLISQLKHQPSQPPTLLIQEDITKPSNSQSSLLTIRPIDYERLTSGQDIANQIELQLQSIQSWIQAIHSDLKGLEPVPKP
jgi:hypothetical protein